jgi:hypothetical protein
VFVGEGKAIFMWTRPTTCHIKRRRLGKKNYATHNKLLAGITEAQVTLVEESVWVIGEGYLFSCMQYIECQ